MICVCSHPKNGHVPEGACRFNGCPCEGFRDPAKVDAPPSPASSRRVTIDIPAGYMLSMSLLPYSEADAALIGSSLEPLVPDGSADGG